MALSPDIASSPLRAELWRINAPMPVPLWTPVGTFDRTNALAVRLSDDQGHQGVGTAHYIDEAGLAQVAQAAQALLGACAHTLGGLLQVERIDARSADCNVFSRRAASALSFAAWDLLGRRAGTACADLWGRPLQRTTLPAYASGLFLNCSEDELVADAHRYRAAGYRLLKMRGGKPPEEDAARHALISSIFPDPGSVAIDIYFQYDAARTRKLIRHFKTPPMWVEDPIRYETMAELRGESCIAAGETCVDQAGLLALCEAGVRNIILDAQELGGPLRFLEAARMLHALGHRVGSHTFAHESPHLLAVLPDSMPVEVLDWWNGLYNESPDPDVNANGRVAVRGPGLGVSLNEATLKHHGQQVL